MSWFKQLLIEIAVMITPLSSSFSAAPKLHSGLTPSVSLAQLIYCVTNILYSMLAPKALDCLNKSALIQLCRDRLALATFLDARVLLTVTAAPDCAHLTLAHYP
jgi:hypothetical protein